MTSTLNLVMAIILMVLSFLWLREGRIAGLSLASQGTRVALVMFSVGASISATMPVASEWLEETPIAFDTTIPLVLWAIRTVIAIILLALVLTASRSRRESRYR